MTAHNSSNAASTAQILTSLSRLLSQQIKEEKEKQRQEQQTKKSNKASPASKNTNSIDDIHNYHTRKAKHQEAMIAKYITVLKEQVPEMRATLAHLSQMLDEKNFSKVQDLLDRVTEHIEQHTQSSTSSSAHSQQHHFDNNSLPRFPFEIKEEIEADIHEAQTCYNAKAYRACIILCGRILETALLRKYFDVTGRDLLETAPGIGLGKTIAKLQEANVTLDPGLTQQIHLINNVRIFSVHKKQTHFAPSPQQAQAIMLYTFDVLKKVF